MPELPLLEGLAFRDPWFLLAALLAPVVFWLASRLPARLEYSSLAIVAAAGGSWRARLRWLPAAALALATLSMAIALAGPRSGDSSSEVRREGIAIMLAVDRSGSMDARDFVEKDFSVSRLDAVRTVLRDFVLGGEHIAGRPDDLIGLVVFGTYADSIAPLTLDHGNLVAMLEDVQVATEQSEAATAIGDGLALAVERLRESAVKSRVVVLLTDGVNNAGAVDPLQAAELAASNDVRVYTIGAGINGVAPMPVRVAGGRELLRPTRVEIDERTLQRIAERTGGLYFHARDAEGLARSYAAIDRLERVELLELRYLEHEEHYAVFVILALALIAIAELASRTVLRQLP